MQVHIIAFSYLARAESSLARRFRVVPVRDALESTRTVRKRQTMLSN